MSAVAYEEKKQRLIECLRSQQGRGVRLGKDTSNLFRDRRAVATPKLDVRDFNHVLRVDPDQGIVEVEAMTPYMRLVDACLEHGAMPAVVPELKSITIGGATTGCGIESSSFKYGLVHETVEELEVLLADGRTVVCTAENEHSDLFYGFPNSYGTLGYVLKLKAKLVPVKRFVKLTHMRYIDPSAYFEDLQSWCGREVDFIDGVVFGKDELYLTIGEFVADAPYSSDYSYHNIYYKSIRERESDYLTVADYIWRWDTDWFWCSKNLFAQNPLIRRLYGRARLNSITYTKIMRWNSRWKLMHYLDRILGYHTESVIQDVQIPVENCERFLDFYHREIQFLPVWICPSRAYDSSAVFDLYPLDPAKLYVNFGFWDVIKGRRAVPEGHYNRKIEAEVRELGGMKSLYSDAFYSRNEFWELYNKPSYERLKQRYDPNGRFKDLYAKCVGRE